MKRDKIPRRRGLKAQIDLGDNMRKVLAALLPEEEQVLRMRFTGHTLEQAAKQLGMTSAQITQIEAKALRKLRLTGR